MLHHLFAADPQSPGDFLAPYWPLILGAVAVIIGLVFFLIFFSFVKLWFQAFLAGAKVGFLDLIRMKLLNIDYNMIVRQNIALVQAGVRVTTKEMEAHVLSRGHVKKVTSAVIAAHKAGMDLPWRDATAIQLAGRNVLEVV